MKSTLLILAVLAIISCNTPSSYHPNKLDTIPHALFKVKANNGNIVGPYYDTVINQIVSKYSFTDSAKSTGGHWTTDTISYGRVVDDTLRHPNKTPIYDSLRKTYLFHTSYYPIPSHYLQPIHFPQ